MHQSSALPSLPLFKQEVPLASSLGPITRLSPAPSTETFLATVRQFFAFGTPTQELCDSGILYLVNEFWTAKQRQAHAIHEISYRACFKPQLPEFFISRLTEPGDSVLDPFMGRGTTPVQAALMGRKPIGNDVNPLSVLLTRPRLAPPSVGEVLKRLGEVPWESGTLEREDLLVFYHPETLRQLCALRRWLLDHAPLSHAKPDPVVDLDSDGSPQSANRTLAGLLFGLHPP